MTAEVVSAAARPLRADAERNRLRIIQAAAEVFARRGLDAGLDEIARHAGVGTGTVYRRFPDKKLLLQALVEQRMSEIEDLLETAVDNPDAWAGLVFFVESFTERAIADRALTDICFSGGVGIDDGSLADRKARIGPLLAVLLERGKQQGAVRPDISVTDLTMIQFMLVAGGAFGDDVRPDLWRRHLAIFLDGIRLHRSEPTPLPAEPLSVDELEMVCGKSGPPGRRPAAVRSAEA